MRRSPIALLTAATAALGVSGAVLGAAGCAAPDQPAPKPFTASPTVAPGPIDAGPLPAPDALAQVIERLADPAVPGAAKPGLVQGAVPADAAAWDRFAAALRDAGFMPITVSASGLRWAPVRVGDVLATVTINAHDGGGEFSFPMEFGRTGDDWQVTRETAEMLLAFGNAQNH